MAAVLLGHSLATRGVSISIQSAGFVSDGVPCPPAVDQVMRPLGYDMSHHRSRALDGSMIGSADLIVGMTRQHLVDLAVRAPDAWKRTFTLAEVARLGEVAGTRRHDESLSAWVARVGGSRTRPGLLSLPLSEDVPDPIGKPLDAFIRTRDLLRSLCSQVADLVAPV
jgi:protein-tyrosine phosphatase